MDKDPLLPTINTAAARRKPPASTPTSVLCPLPEDDELFLSSFFFPASPTPSPSSSFKDRLIFGGGAGEPQEPPPSPIAVADLPPSSSSSSSSDDDPSWLSKIRTTGLHRSRTAPAMSTLNEVLAAPQNPPFSAANPSSAEIVRQAILFLLAYLSFGVLVYTLGRHHFTSTETHPVVDALYFSIVTMCTIGYGDITPHTALAKVFSIGFVLIGFGFIDILLTGMVSYVLDLQESILLSAAKARKAGEHDVRSFIVDFKKGRMRIRMKVGLALGVVFLCIGVGMGVMHFVEQLGWLDSFYLSVMSVTTVGYGDQAFKSLTGRLFASIWLLVSTLAVARAFLYLAEYRIDKRHRMIAKWVLGRDMTVSEFLAADIDNNGFVSKSEYVVYKLKEMGRISEKDIVQICDQFKKLDAGNCGKITLSDLIGSHNGISRDR